jgi:hypothetical protein
MVYYGVAGGPHAGVYDNWAEAESASKGHKGAKVKKFKTKEEAVGFSQHGWSVPVSVETNGTWKRNEIGPALEARTPDTSVPAGFVAEKAKCGLCAGTEGTSVAQGVILHIMLLLKPRNLVNHKICTGCRQTIEFLIFTTSQPLNASVTQTLGVILDSARTTIMNIRRPQPTSVLSVSEAPSDESSQRSRSATPERASSATPMTRPGRPQPSSSEDRSSRSRSRTPRRTSEARTASRARSTSAEWSAA